MTVTTGAFWNLWVIHLYLSLGMKQQLPDGTMLFKFARRAGNLVLRLLDYKRKIQMCREDDVIFVQKGGMNG